MKWRSALCSLFVFSHLVFCSAQLSCSQVQYTPTSCLEVRRTQPQSNSASNSDCTASNQTGLVTFEEEGQFESLRTFVKVLLLDNELVWLGYYYDASGNNVLLRDGDAVSESAVFSDSQNFAEGGVSAGDGVCIAIGKDGLLNRRTCSDMLPYACYQEWALTITSVTVSPSRFLTNGSPVTLTCSFQPSSATATWWQDNVLVPDTEDQSITASPGTSTLIINMVQDGFLGLYECRVTNSVGGVVSEGITLAAAGGVDGPAPTITSIDVSLPIADILTDSTVTLTCNSNDTSATYAWFYNGLPIPSATTRTYTVANFNSGYYQCRASLATGENTIATLRLDARDPPSPDDSISAFPLNRSSILVSWIPPIFSRDPLLLRYSLFYTEGVSLTPNDYSNAVSVSNILPILKEDGTISNLVQYELAGLSVGTGYWISVRASFQDLNATNSFYVAQAATYGRVPADPVKGLNVSRTTNNKSLVAYWTKVETAPPTGEVVFYEIEYRNLGKDISMKARISAFYDFYSILGLEDATDYEVRVSAGVQVNRDPPQYEFNEPTKWVIASGVVTTVPPQPPTAGPLRPRLSGGEIAAVVVCVTVVFLVALVLLAGLAALIIKNSKDENKGGTDDTDRIQYSAVNEDHKEKEESPVTDI